MSIQKAYEKAKEIYSELGVDTDKALELLKNFTLSVHCWQGDDVGGFENSGASLDGGLAATGNYPGKARNPKELRDDMAKAFEFIPGIKKANIHAMYLESDSDKKIDRDEIEPTHFDGWVNWAKEQKTGIDFNPTYFSHPKASDGFTLSSSDESIRKFWVEHTKRCRKISEYIGKQTGIRSLNNIWIPDGFKDFTIDKTAPRERLMQSLDESISEKLDPAATGDAVESKLFGIGSESYVVGSHEFYLCYVMKNKQLLLTLDAGHFHPAEFISAKIATIMMFIPELLLHVSRPVRWDSDHVVVMDDELLAICQEIVRGDYGNRINVALDYFDASINRIAAMVIGSRNTLKAMLRAYLEPVELLKKAEADGDLTTRLALLEELKSYPFQSVWDYYCEINNVPVRDKWLADVKKYENDVLSKRI
ncbi:MAG: L-rhamnose isomerase [Oscillospiraceae bacterium]|nr:L-rhamnose isomerase [Oscillospiraceae bacterium]